MRFLLVILVVFFYASRGQDKLFFNNGTVKKGVIVSIAREVVYFKYSDTSATQTINKADLVMTENYRGQRFIFGESKKTNPDSLQLKPHYKRNAFGVQPLGIFVGRATFVYELYTEDHKIGFVFPMSVTFDPFGSLYNSPIDTNRNAVKRITGVNFIGGLDVNFYTGKRKNRQFFIGPRFRYGTDLFLRGIEAYSLQTQLGWRFGSSERLVTQHFSVGFGFANVLSAFQGPLVRSKKFYGWYSINYRVGIGW
jgi:hypothetical protein